MKKWIILVITIAIIPLVEALTLFGEEVSMLILLPSILILIILVVFISIIVKDKIKSKSLNTYLKLDTLKPTPTEDLTGELPPIEPPTESLTIEKPSSEEPTPKTQTIQKPRIDYLKEIQLLEKESFSEDIAPLHKKLNELIKRFFSDYLNIDYNFTFEELEKELKKRSKRVQCFSNNISSITYGPEEISKESLAELLKEFKEIVISSTQENQTLTPEFKKEVEEKEKRIDALLKKGEKLIGKDITEAKEKYNEIFELYNTLPDKEKEAIRASIINFYSKLKL